MVNRCIIFTSKTCKDCFALTAHYEQLADQFPEIEFIPIDVGENPQVGIDHQIYSVPAIELYDKNELIAELKHGSSLQYSHIVNFIKVHVLLRKEK
ncbi:thioredoxin family protein [Mollicutes bacterium LVI A0039]|nr:thioredoxin family protein [Mollicutes bacterium LVI A0039]